MTQTIDSCYGVKTYPTIKVAEYGEVVGDDKLMAEIYARGPVVCAIRAESILDYKGGVVKNTSNEFSHYISLAGWGIDDGVQYWVGRNSWFVNCFYFSRHLPVHDEPIVFCRSGGIFGGS
jgi:cathepsin X